MRGSPTTAIDMKKALRPVGQQIVRIEGGRVHPTTLAKSRRPFNLKNVTTIVITILQNTVSGRTGSTYQEQST